MDIVEGSVRKDQHPFGHFLDQKKTTFYSVFPFDRKSLRWGLNRYMKNGTENKGYGACGGLAQLGEHLNGIQTHTTLENPKNNFITN